MYNTAMMRSSIVNLPRAFGPPLTSHGKFSRPTTVSRSVMYIGHQLLRFKKNLYQS